MQMLDGIAPPNEFLSSTREFREAVRSPKALGIVPVKEFLLKSMVFALVNCPSDDGIVPDKLFKLTATKLIKLNEAPKHDGRVETNEFVFILRVIKLVMSQTELGIVPYKQLL